MDFNQFAALNYDATSTKCDVYYKSGSSFTSILKPSIPGFPAYTSLHYEPDNNITTYVNADGATVTMSNEEKQLLKEYVINTNFPGGAYDPLRDNAYTGIMTLLEAEENNYKIVYDIPTSHTTKYNETLHKWEAVHAVISPVGRVAFFMKSIVDDDDTDAGIIAEGQTTTCSGSELCYGRMRDAAMILTLEEWNDIKTGWVNTSTLYDFTTKTWVDTRTFDELRNDVVTIISRYTSDYYSRYDEARAHAFPALINLIGMAQQLSDERLNTCFENIPNSDTKARLIFVTATDTNTYIKSKEDFISQMLVFSCEVYEVTTKVALNDLKYRIDDYVTNFFECIKTTYTPKTTDTTTTTA